MWEGGGEHFGFLNQPAAGEHNFRSLVSAVLPLLDGDDAAKAEAEARADGETDFSFTALCGTQVTLKLPAQLWNCQGAKSSAHRIQRGAIRKWFRSHPKRSTDLA